MRRRQAAALHPPFVLHNPYRVGAGPRPVSVAAMEVGDGYFCVEFQLGISQVTAYVVKRDQIGSRYQLLQEDYKPIVSELVIQALRSGATLEAIQLLGQLTPLTIKQEGQMATAKLAKPAGPDKEALAKASKVATAKATGKAPPAAAPPKANKGNPEALAKARAARSGSGDARKITVLNKEHGARAGTFRAKMLEDMFKSKTVGDWKAKNFDGKYDGGCLKFAIDSGFVSVSD